MGPGARDAVALISMSEDEAQVTRLTPFTPLASTSRYHPHQHVHATSHHSCHSCLECGVIHRSTSALPRHVSPHDSTQVQIQSAPEGAGERCGDYHGRMPLFGPTD